MTCITAAFARERAREREIEGVEVERGKKRRRGPPPPSVESWWKASKNTHLFPYNKFIYYAVTGST